jgi:hypothetical protein
MTQIVRPNHVDVFRCLNVPDKDPFSVFALLNHLCNHSVNRPDAIAPVQPRYVHGITLVPRATLLLSPSPLMTSIFDPSIQRTDPRGVSTAHRPPWPPGGTDSSSCCHIRHNCDMIFERMYCLMS